MLLLLCLLYKVVGRSLDTVINETILHIGKHIQSTSQLVVELNEGREISLLCLVAVVSLCGIYCMGITRCDGACAIVIPEVMVTSYTTCQLNPIILIGKRGN